MSRRDPYELDPMDHPERWERLVGEIVTSAEPHLAGRRHPPRVTGLVASWARPSLAAAAAVMILFSSAARLTGERGNDPAPEPTLAQSLVPETYAAWLTVDYEPTLTELVIALEGDAP